MLPGQHTSPSVVPPVPTASDTPSPDELWRLFSSAIAAGGTVRIQRDKRHFHRAWERQLDDRPELPAAVRTYDQADDSRGVVFDQDCKTNTSHAAVMRDNERLTGWLAEAGCAYLCDSGARCAGRPASSPAPLTADSLSPPRGTARLGVPTRNSYQRPVRYNQPSGRTHRSLGVIRMAQPNMGPRKQYLTRPPAEVGRAFEKELAGTGKSRSQHLADLIAERYKLRRPSERFRTKTTTPAQASLPLGKEVRRRRPAPHPPRDQYATRLPQDVAAAFEKEVADLGPDWTYSLFLADLLAARYDLPLPSQRHRRSHATTDEQEVLPLGRAS